jgi:hypothetical protein
MLSFWKVALFELMIDVTTAGAAYSFLDLLVP